MGKFTGRVPAGTMSKASLLDWVDADFQRRWPAIHEHLSLTEHDGGETRATSSLTLFCEDGRLKVCLSDKDNGRMAFASADTFQGLLDLLEAGLVTGSMDWRVSRTPSGRGGRK